MIEPREVPSPDAGAGQTEDADGRRMLAWRALLAWYAAEGRASLPWRHTRDPYAVLVSEVMLQQTQVERVLPKYRAFLDQFPTLADLAAAPVADVIRAWAGLGYNMRAIRLHEIARQAVERYGGALPGSLDELLELKGIGRYTAGAVACFAFGLPVATVDTNIRRVLWRVFRGVEPYVWPADTAFQRQMLALAEWALPPDGAYDWQQALMDLGATVCLARRPFCERCPLAASCAAYQEAARVSLFPSGEAVARLRDERAALDASHNASRDASHPRETGDEAAPSVRKVAERRARYAARTPRASRAPAQPFTTTSRYFRGRVVATLRELPAGATLSLAELGPRLKPEYTAAEYPWLRTLVERLARDGLVRLTGNPEDASVARVALP